jgi:predicted GH43/DUF377 family glycosyl hydrolase
MGVRVTRLPLKLMPDPNRVITRFFCPGDRLKAQDIIKRVLTYTEPDVSTLLAEVDRAFRAKHPDLTEVLAEHFEQVRDFVPNLSLLGRERQLLIGACFTMEYAIEAVALFNPSIVPALRQDGLAPGSLRFLMSLRATGEGHVSSIVFRMGVIDADGEIQIETPPIYAKPLKASGTDHFEKSIFLRDLAAMGISDKHVDQVITSLDDVFTREQLAHAIESARQNEQTSGFLEATADALISLTRVNYELTISGPTIFREFEIVVFPFSDIERHGIEDLRLVRFTDDDESQTYYGTYTAFNGLHVFPQLFEFRGGTTINISLITGECAKNKGMALFPRRVRGKYAMISRMDSESLYYMESDDVRVWNEARLLLRPTLPWQVIQIGNCGSPLETDRGWLLLTHGVGPMRQYCIGAILLDRDDPCRVIGQTRDPLLVANDEERSGYVPNVVYTCGALIHNGMLILPYAMSDSSTSVARVDLDELLGSMEAL